MQATFFVIDVHIPFVHTAFVEALMPTSDYKRGQDSYDSAETQNDLLLK